MDAKLFHSDTVWAADQPLLTALRDVALVPSEEGLVLHVVGGPLPGFQVSAWGLGAGGLSMLDSTVLPGEGQAGTEPFLESVTTSGGRPITVLLGDGSGNPTGLWQTGAGGFESSFSIDVAGAREMRDQTALATVADGAATFVFGLGGGSQSPAIWEIEDDGTFGQIAAGTVAPPQNGIDAPGLTDLAAFGPHLAAGGTGDAILSLYRIRPDGRPVLEDSLGASENPGMAGQVVLAMGETNGVAHVIAGAAQSGTLTVWARDADGRLRLTDHLLDSRDSRFQGVTQLEAVTHEGNTWIAAGGADHGVSLFRLLSSGRLVQVAQLADGLEWSLDGLAALDLAADAEGLLHLVTAGLRDGGISHFTFAPHGLVEGGERSETLTGTAQADILRDGAGADTLTGGAGADIFVFDSDGQTDVVTDFDPSEDRLDLSGWTLFRGAHQLSIQPRDDGAEVIFEGVDGTERLVLLSASGRALDPGAVRAAVLAGPDRLLPRGLEAVMSQVPVDALIEGTPQGDGLVGQAGNDTILGFAGSDRLSGGAGDDSLVGGIGFDTLRGGSGNDTLRGLDGFDSLLGGIGDDLLFGNNGNDTLSGGAGDDTLFGGLGADHLSGNDGNDSLSGGPGPDLLEAGTGTNILRGNAGPDTLIGGSGTDRLEGGINHDLLDGGAGDDLLFGGDGRDTLYGGPGDDTLQGNAGDDWLEGGGGNDLLDGGIGADTFVFRGGQVRIVNFQNTVDTILFDPALRDQGARDIQDILSGAETVASDTIFDFGADGRLIIVGIDDPMQIEDAIGFL